MPDIVPTIEAPVKVIAPIGPTTPEIPHQPSLPPTSTVQEDLTTAGQRNINLLWENTQGQIARNVIFGTMIINGSVLLLSLFFNKDLTAAQALALGFVNSLATGVVSFYFSRTNHEQIGGVGHKPTEEYKGR